MIGKRFVTLSYESSTRRPSLSDHYQPLLFLVCRFITITMISGLAHVNLLVPAGTLDKAEAFYGGTLGLTPRAVPKLQAGTLAW